MRLIDADALIKEVDGDLMDSISEGIAIEKIMDAPTIEPERHGRWIKDSDGVIVCSECENVALQRLFLITDDMRYEVRMAESNYCPNCGARMEGENDG